ncbi:hypothetical protein ABH931_006614 [Streptacidiphilus sp. MAP12-33]|uniref:hypothetical protein n=1 Tax=Streptacidiphilus sp. MAP12-33 TaxID=3156266 RepID=UPI003512B918
MGIESWYGSVAGPAGSRLAVPELADHLGRALDDLDYPANTTSMNPVLLPYHRYAELFDATGRLLQLLRRALFGSAPDFHGRLRALGAVEENYALWVPGPLEEAYATCMTRPDVAVGATGPKFLEFNIGSGIGGVVETSVHSAAWKAAYGGDAGPFHRAPDPLAVRDQIFVRAVRELGTAPAVAVVGALREFNAVRTTRYFDLQVASLRRQGLQAEYFEPEHLLEGLGLSDGGATPRYPLGLRHFNIYDWTRLGIDLAPMRAALDAGCFLIASQTAYLVANKKVLGWVSEGLPWMTAADHALVARYLPWTRTVTDRLVHWQDTRLNLPELLLSRQEEFVLKPAIGLGSQGVVLGRHVDEATWRATLETALSSGQYIAQEYVEPVPYRMELRESDGAVGEADVFPVLSPFLFDGEPGGCLVRYLPPGREGCTTIQGNGALPSVALPV